MRIVYGQYVFLLPIVTNVWVIVGFSSTFAMTYNSSAPDFPYVSYTGTKIPQRGIFTLVTTVAAVLAAVNGVLRFKFLTHFRVIRDNQHLNRANKASIVIGFVSVIGLTLVGCFQVDSMRVPHYLGAFTCFALALVYMFIQAILTLNLKTGKSDDNSMTATSCKWQCIFISQLGNAISSLIFLISFAIGHAIYQREKKKNIGTKFDILRGIYLCASISEWLLCLSIIVFLLTFIPNFRRISGLKVDVRPRDEQSRKTIKENKLLGDGVELT